MLGDPSCSSSFKPTKRRGAISKGKTSLSSKIGNERPGAIPRTTTDELRRRHGPKICENDQLSKTTKLTNRGGRYRRRTGNIPDSADRDASSVDDSAVPNERTGAADFSRGP